MTTALSSALDEFAAEVGRDGPVCVVGGRTQWGIGSRPTGGHRSVREVVAPSGVVSHQPAEMIVRVRAGTTVASLNASLAAGNQMVPLDPADPERATVGGVVAVGHSGIRRLRYGPVRDTVLELRFVNASGQLVTAGGPVVKNVTGFDLCRLLVGSLGTLGLLAEMVLRCYPQPAASRWFRTRSAGTDPFDLMARLYRPSSILWDGTSVWVLLEGHPVDVGAQVFVLGAGWDEVDGPPPVGFGARMSLTPDQLRRLVPGAGGGGWLAQIGVGAVDAVRPVDVALAVGLSWPPVLDPGVARLHQALTARFDPAGRLNPARQVP